MKVLFTRFPYESSYGGAEVQTMSLIRGLLARGHAAAFVGSCPVLLEACEQEGIIAGEVDIGKPPVSKWTALSFTWRKKKMTEQLKAVLREFKNIDAICMLSLSEKILLTPFALEQGIRVFWIEHDRVGAWLRKNPCLKTLRGFSSRVTTVCVSDLSKDLYLELGYAEKNVVAIPNGVDVTNARPEPRPNGNVVQAGCIARLSKDKGVDVLLRALCGVPSMYLRILGTGHELRALKQKAFALGVKDRVQFVESVENIDEFYTQLDVLILPSRDNDPFGMVVAEAMMRGIPTIITNACGIARHIQANHDALVVKAGSWESLQDAMRVITDVEIRRRIGEQGRKAALEHFTLETMIDRYEQLLS